MSKENNPSPVKLWRLNKQRLQPNHGRYFSERKFRQSNHDGPITPLNRFSTNGVTTEVKLSVPECERN